MALSAAQRKALPASEFVFPQTRSYPIPDRAHAMVALTDSSGKPEAPAVRHAVCSKFGMGCGSKA